MSTERPTRPLPRHPSVWRSRWRWRWPFLVWLAILALAVWLYDSGGEYIRVNAMVEVITESVAPLNTGRLLQIDVVQGQAVEAGQVVARMDAGFLAEELAVLAERIQRDRAQDERQFAQARQRLLADQREYELELADATIEAGLYAAELERVEPLVRQGLLRAEELAGIRARRDVAANRARLLPDILAGIEAELAELDELRQRVLSGYDAEATGTGLTRMNLLRREIAAMTLRAQQAGVVSRVRRSPGEIVDAGQGVVEVVTRIPPRILAFMSETDTRPVTVGDVVEIEAAVGRIRFKAQVTAISPNVLALPDRASPIPDRVVRGRRLDLVPLEPVELVPGSSMVVILPRGRTFWRNLVGGAAE